MDNLKVSCLRIQISKNQAPNIIFMVIEGDFSGMVVREAVIEGLEFLPPGRFVEHMKILALEHVIISGRSQGILKKPCHIKQKEPCPNRKVFPQHHIPQHPLSSTSTPSVPLFYLRNYVVSWSYELATVPKSGLAES